MNNLAPIFIRIQEAAIDVAAEYAHLQGDGSIGATALFVGSVRGGNVRQLFLEHYPAMTEKALHNIATSAATRWQTLAIRVIHRIGALPPGEPIVFVGVATAHRTEAFAACEYITDYLKNRAPFWKKETYQDSEQWVEANAKDEAALKRWE